MLECVYIYNLVSSCVVYVPYYRSGRACVCAYFSIYTSAPGEVHVTLLIISLQTAVRAPAEVVGLKLDLFHLKDQISPETQTSKVTSR